MEISQMLLMPSIERLSEEFHELDRELVNEESEAVLQLKGIIQRKLRQLQMLKVAVSYLDNAADNNNIVPSDLHASFRRLKLELRFARRKWKRLLSNEIRFQKSQEKRVHVSTFAA